MAPTVGSAGAAVHVRLLCPTCLQFAHLRLYGGGGSIGGRMSSKDDMVEEIMETKVALATKKNCAKHVSRPTITWLLRMHILRVLPGLFLPNFEGRLINKQLRTYQKGCL